MRRRLLVPEAIQTSAMDCGPASLKALLAGCGIHASYGRLREAWQTGVDGTSIDALEVAAVQLGLDAVQVMLPADHLLAPESEALPCLVVVRQPSGQTHFVVVWRRHGNWLQLMDPAIGRRWMPIHRFLADLYLHRQSIPADAWNQWSASDSFRKVLAARIRHAGASPDALLASGDLARLDAATRMTEAWIESGALRRGRESGRVLANVAASDMTIPTEYWTAEPDSTEPANVYLRGAVLIQVSGTRPADVTEHELAAALTEKPTRPLRELLSRVPPFSSATLAGALAVAASAVVIEALLLRGFFDLGRELVTAGQRLAAISGLLAFSLILLALEFSIARGILRLARILEVKLRLDFLAKVPRLEDRYFQSRPISDMGDRSHNVHQLRTAPDLASRFLRAVLEMVLTVAAIGWFYPDALWPAALLAFVAIGIPIAAQPVLAERDLRLRSHSGALTRYYLDALLGLTAIRAHTAALAVQREQRALLGEWARAGLSLQRAVVGTEGLQLAVSLLISAGIVLSRLGQNADIGGLLLLVYWVLNLPVLGQEAATVAWQYPMLRNTALRLIEPLGAPESPHAVSTRDIPSPSVQLDAVTVRAGGHVILDNVSLDIPAGSHVAIVGPSGAGKSSLVGLLLGWHRPASGNILINGQALDAALLDSLRRATAWVDPQVQLWNRSLIDNLRYGAPASAIDEVLDHAELSSVLSRLPRGFDTALGEGGALVSGGEGQRVRMGRAMGRSQASLVILDEPARGLDRGRRREMIQRARRRWQGATLLCITHDLEDTRGFERVLVIENARIVEDGAPSALAGNLSSRYRALLDAEDAVRRGLWSSANWRRLRLDGGRLEERERRGVHAGSRV